MTEKDQSKEIMNMVNRFIAIANELKDQGVDVKLVNTALQLASGTYATYLAAGNEGYLQASGIEKVTEGYKHNLTRLQELKKQQLNPDNKD